MNKIKTYWLLDILFISMNIHINLFYNMENNFRNNSTITVVNTAEMVQESINIHCFLSLKNNQKLYPVESRLVTLTHIT